MGADETVTQADDARRRRPRRVVVLPPKSSLAAAINVTPLVDVVLVLLIIFMVVTPLMERQLDVRVPETRVSATLPPEPQLTVTIDADDGLRIEGERVAAESYRSRLKEALDARQEAARSVFFIASDESGYRALVRAIDEAKAAGATRVGMVTD